MSKRHGPRRRQRCAVALMLIAALAVAACTGGSATAPTTTTPPPTTEPGGSARPAGLRGVSDTLALRLSQGRSQAAPVEPVPVVNGEPLDQATIDAIQARLPEWAGGESLQQTFNWPAQTLPPPRTGQTVDVPFPPPTTSRRQGRCAHRPLEVLRFQPEGDVAIAPFVSITFNQPMVPVGTLDQLDAADVPATITPDVPGRWQWIGTRTLRFDADVRSSIDRLPMATEYTVDDPRRHEVGHAARRSPNDVTFNFTTPPVPCSRSSPTGDSLPLDPVFVATFDQRSTPTPCSHRVLRRRRRRRERAAGHRGRDRGRRHRPADRRAARRGPLAGLPARRSAARRRGDHRRDRPRHAVGRRPADDRRGRTFTGRTYAPLRSTRSTAARRRSARRAATINVEFNNAARPGQFDPARSASTRQSPGMVVGVYGNTIDDQRRRPRPTRVHGHGPDGSTDIFGQTLATTADDTIDDRRGRRRSSSQFAQPLTTLDPLGRHALRSPSARSATTSSGSGCSRSTPSDWADYRQPTLERDHGQPDRPTPPDWPTLIDTTRRHDSEPDRLTETDDRSRRRARAATHRSRRRAGRADARRTAPNSNEYWQNRPTITWVQATDLGVDAVRRHRRAAWSGPPTCATGAPLAAVSASPAGADVGDDRRRWSRHACPLAIDGHVAGRATVATTRRCCPAVLRQTLAQRAVPDEAALVRLRRPPDLPAGRDRVDQGLGAPPHCRTDAQLQLIGDGATVDYTVADAQGNEIGNGRPRRQPARRVRPRASTIPPAPTSATPTSSSRLTVPRDLAFAASQHSFQIEEFRRPEFEVDARTRAPGRSSAPSRQPWPSTPTTTPAARSARRR